MESIFLKNQVKWTKIYTSKFQKSEDVEKEEKIEKIFFFLIQ